MATHIECDKHIPVYTPEQVFEAGTRAKTIPRMDGLALEVMGPQFALGVAVNIGVMVAQLSYHIEASVTEFEPAECVFIKGKSPIGTATVWLNMSPDEEHGGTAVEYGIGVNYSLLTRLVEPLVGNHLRAKAPLFADLYTDNVIQRLDQAQRVQRPARRKKAA